MSDQPLSDDELLSSLLDGELTVDEDTRLAERLASDPALRSRLAEVRAARELSSTPVTPLTGTDADRMIAVALAASGTSADVIDLAAAGARRSTWATRVATVAAGVVGLALAVTAVRALDTGDDTDAASTGDRSFDAAPADDGDAETAGDTAQELDAAAATAPLADNAADMAPDEMSADPTDGDAEDGLAGALAYSTAQFRLFDVDADFDPLGDELGDFASTETLSATVSQTWSGYEPPAPPTTTTSADTTPPDAAETAMVERDDLLRAANARLDAFSFDVCTDVADLIIDFFDGQDVVAADYASATVAGAPVVVGLFRQPGERAVLLVIDLATCEVRDVRLS